MNAETTADVVCPSCGEVFTVQISGNSEYVEFIEDCMVCCKPASIRARISGGECVEIEVFRS